MSLFPSVQQISPVLDIELRQRSRSRRSVVVMTGFLVIMIVISLLVYEGSTANSGFNNDPISALTNGVGRQMFEWVVFAELGILLLIIPGISAGAIAGEQDRQTLVPLQVTLIGPWGIFLGKVMSSSSFILLLIIATVPVMAVPYLVGGISLTQVFATLLSLLVLGVLLSVIGVSCSAIFKRAQTATLFAYAFVVALTIGTIVASVALTVARGFDERGADTENVWPLYANPFIAVADAAGDIDARYDSGPFSPMKGMFEPDRFDQFGNEVFFEQEAMAIEEEMFFNGQNGGAPIDGDSSFSIPLWVRSLGTLSVVSLLLSLIGVKRLKAPRSVISV